mmetsp:Transcript_6140/g.14250  ORF Transcript_6140/g.14250 Transcript_6140/m.14250 type:complete len:531 (-) Transcript_6140:17-1609(-)
MESEHQLALLDDPDENEGAIVEYQEPIAEAMFNRKRMLKLENGLNNLQKSAQRNYEVVNQIESGMKAMISEGDLRRALGLAFEEFEHRLEEAFAESSRKSLSLFSKREEVEEMQGQIAKRVSRSEYNHVIKKLADLRLYIETMAESVFIGHREALDGKFAEKADQVSLDEVVRQKADNDSVNEVRARLERLEAQLRFTDSRQAAAIEALREELTTKTGERMNEAQASINANLGKLSELKDEWAGLQTRLGSAEAGITKLGQTCKTLREGQEGIKTNQDEVSNKMAAVQDHLVTFQEFAERLTQSLNDLAADTADFKEKSDKSSKGLSTIVNSNKERVEFLLEETEMIKRRAKEHAKTQSSGFKELTGEQEKLLQQLQALERDTRKQVREFRALESRTAQATAPHTALEGLRALTQMAAPTAPAYPIALPTGAESGDRMKYVMEQLEALAFGGPASPSGPGQERPFNPERPPLPIATKVGDLGLSKLPKYSGSLVEQVQTSIDSARGGVSGRTAYAMSPRDSGQNSARRKR